jgi:DNA polymerase III epsilon subunit-like protein
MKFRLLIGDNMTWAVKLKISTLDCNKVYETGKDNVTSININSEDRIIEIAQNKSEMDHIVIPFSTMIYFKYKAEEHRPIGGVPL